MVGLYKYMDEVRHGVVLVVWTVVCVWCGLLRVARAVDKYEGVMLGCVSSRRIASASESWIWVMGRSLVGW